MEVDGGGDKPVGYEDGGVVLYYGMVEGSVEWAVGVGDTCDAAAGG